MHLDGAGKKFITKFRTKGLMTSGNYLADPMGIAITDDRTVLVSDCEIGCLMTVASTLENLVGLTLMLPD